MAAFIRVNFTVSSDMDNEIKREAKNRGLSVSDYCRQKISGSIKQEELDRVTLESRIEKLENQQEKLIETIYFQNRFLYNFAAICAGNDELAQKAWELTKSEIERR